MASLWPVADESTRRLMQQFYRMRNTTAGLPKADALRSAQLSLLHGEQKETATNNAARGVDEVPSGGFTRNPNAPYAHPFFWAPFILIGNWR